MKIANITTECLNGLMTSRKYLSYFKNLIYCQNIKAYYAYHSLISFLSDKFKNELTDQRMNPKIL